MAIDSLHCNDRVQELTHSAWAQLFSNWWSNWWSLQLFSKFPKVWVLQWCRHSFPMFPVCSRSIVADSRCPAKPRHVETCPEDMQRHALKARLQQQDIIIYIIRMCLLLLLVMFILKYSMILNVYSARILLGMFWPAFPPADPLWPWESVQRLLCPVAAQSTISLGSGILSTCQSVRRTWTITTQLNNNSADLSRVLNKLSPQRTLMEWRIQFLHWSKISSNVALRSEHPSSRCPGARHHEPVAIWDETKC